MIVIPKYSQKSVFWTKVFNKLNFNVVRLEGCCTVENPIDCNLYESVVYIDDNT